MSIPKYLYAITNGSRRYVFTMYELSKHVHSINRLVGSVDWTPVQFRLSHQDTDSATYMNDSGESITVAI